MKKNKAINAIATIMLFVLIVIGNVSCSEDEAQDINHDNEVVNYHQTANTQFITAGKTSYAYRILGNKAGVPLVMISALGNSMDDWDPAITNGLAQQFTVIIFDIQGVGSSSGVTPNNIPEMANGVVAFINALGYSKVNLMGFSMGGFITQQIALTNPALVNKIILTGTGPKGAEGLSNLPNILKTTVGLSPEEIFLASFFVSSAESQSAGNLSYRRILERTVNRDAPVNAESVKAGLIAVLGWAHPEPDALIELKGITKPTFIAHGENDLLVQVSNAINMAASMPDAQLNVYQDAGHGAIYQYHEKFVPAALEFLSK